MNKFIQGNYGKLDYGEKTRILQTLWKKGEKHREDLVISLVTLPDSGSL